MPLTQVIARSQKKKFVLGAILIRETLREGKGVVVKYGVFARMRTIPWIWCEGGG